jgi:hypothetical protein
MPNAGQAAESIFYMPIQTISHAINPAMTPKMIRNILSPI